MTGWGRAVLSAGSSAGANSFPLVSPTAPSSERGHDFKIARGFERVWEKFSSPSRRPNFPSATGMSDLLPLCLWCNREFQPRRSGGSRQAFCCPRHRVAFHSAARRWAERAVASGVLTIAELQNGPTAACTLVSDEVSPHQVLPIPLVSKPTQPPSKWRGL